MKRALALLAAGLAMPAGAAIADGVSNGDGHPGCKPSHDTPPKCHTTSTETEPGTTSTVTVTVPGPVTTVTAPAPPAPPPTVVVTPGPTSQTVTITITINGVPQSITVPGTLPATPCVNTRRTALLGPLPTRYHAGLTVTTRVNGSTQNGRVQAGRKVNVRLPAACGPVALVVNDRPNTRQIRPVLRIWLLEGGNRIVRVGFPLPVPPVGLS